MRHFFVEVIPATLKWFWQNWWDIFTTMWNFTKTIAVNIGGLELSRQAAKVGVTGTFNAAALLGLQSGDAADRTAKATEETAKNAKKLLDEARQGGLTFL